MSDDPIFIHRPADGRTGEAEIQEGHWVAQRSGVMTRSLPEVGSHFSIPDLAAAVMKYSEPVGSFFGVDFRVSSVLPHDLMLIADKVQPDKAHWFRIIDVNVENEEARNG